MNIKHAKIILALLIAALTLALCGCSGGDIQPPAETDAPRQPVRIEVSDTKVIARVLDKMGVEYSIASDTAADIFADVQATELIEKAAKELIHLRDEIAAEKDGIPPKTLIVLCALTNAAYQRPDGVYVVPITALKD